ncbi:hypothetical protein AB1Y20_020093 [Prymnesium parvum]|uniref:PDZ domain-containing protein n=1 Tax=Prymnesium parvum TaxID=97485 RepID=A0AB34JWZ3_PRYPA
MISRSLSFTRRNKGKSNADAEEMKAESRKSPPGDDDTSDEDQPPSRSEESPPQKPGIVRRALRRGEKAEPKDKAENARGLWEDSDDESASASASDAAGSAKGKSNSIFRRTPSFGRRGKAKDETSAKENGPPTTDADDSDEEGNQEPSEKDEHDGTEKLSRMGRMRRAASFGRRPKNTEAKTNQRSLWDESDEDVAEQNRPEKKDGILRRAASFGRKSNRKGNEKDGGEEEKGEEGGRRRRRSKKDEAPPVRDLWNSDDDETQSGRGRGRRAKGKGKQKEGGGRSAETSRASTEVGSERVSGAPSVDFVEVAEEERLVVMYSGKKYKIGVAYGRHSSGCIVISRLYEGYPAYRNGELVIGDVVNTINGERVETLSEAYRITAKYAQDRVMLGLLGRIDADVAEDLISCTCGARLTKCKCIGVVQA